MRKRSSYRPRRVLANPMSYVLAGMESVKTHSSHILDLQLKNHNAMAALTQGKATRADIDLLVAMVNMVEALWRLGFGQEYREEVDAGLDALHTVGSRGAATSKFILRSSEMEALNTIMDLHDAQMEIITIKDLENAMEIIRKEERSKRMRPMKATT